MVDINISQEEGDALIEMEKMRADEMEWDFPSSGGSLQIPLVSLDKRENFILDVTKRGRIDLTKGSYQNRAKQVVILVRLDFDGRPHRNPDGSEIGSPHLHLYREGFGDKWAAPVPANHFSDTQDIWLTLVEFMKYCNISEPPNIRKGLFT